MTQHILMIGATGMLGRPVARRLIQGGYRVRALVRDVKRARNVLPKEIALIKGDLRDQESIRAAMNGIDAVHLNLAAPMAKRPPEFEPELHGTRAVIAAAKTAGVRHVLRISAMGVEEAAGHWWAARHKAEADRAIMESGIAYTIFRPTWLMESIATLKMGPLILLLNLKNSPLRWIAGDDYARQVVAALQSERSKNRVYHPQGPELLTIKQAVRRFMKAWPSRLMPIPFPLTAMGALAPLSAQMSYLRSLMVMTRDHFARIDREAIATDLPAATMTIEDYVGYVQRTGDLPHK